MHVICLKALGHLLNGPCGVTVVSNVWFSVFLGYLSINLFLYFHFAAVIFHFSCVGSKQFVVCFYLYMMTEILNNESSVFKQWWSAARYCRIYTEELPSFTPFLPSIFSLPSHSKLNQIWSKLIPTIPSTSWMTLLDGADWSTCSWTLTRQRS